MRVTGTACGLLLMAALFSCNGAKEPEYTEDFVAEPTEFVEVLSRALCDWQAQCSGEPDSADECFERTVENAWMFECFSMTAARACIDNIEAIEASEVDPCQVYLAEACSRSTSSSCQ